MRRLEELLQGLVQKIVLMGTIAEGMLGTAMQILIERNESYVPGLLAKELQVNRLQIEIDNTCVALAVTQQPMAQDARLVFMASRISGELERIGGSRAQLDLVEFTLLKAYLGAHRPEDARRMLSRRQRGTASVPVAEMTALQ